MNSFIRNIDKHYIKGFFLVFFAGLLWSFGAIIVRYMIDANQYQPQYLFYRGIAIATILCSYLFIKEGYNFYKNFYKIGLSGIFGGICLATAFMGFIFSITMTTAALGGDLEAPTLDGGKTRVKIPKGSQNNKQLRLKGKGMPSIRGGIKGDLYIEILVETPVNLNAEQIQLLKKFEDSCKDNNPVNKDFFSKVKNFWNTN